MYTFLYSTMPLYAKFELIRVYLFIYLFCLFVFNALPEVRWSYRISILVQFAWRRNASLLFSEGVSFIIELNKIGLS